MKNGERRVSIEQLDKTLLEEIPAKQREQWMLNPLSLIAVFCTHAHYEELHCNCTSEPIRRWRCPLHKYRDAQIKMQKQAFCTHCGVAKTRTHGDGKRPIFLRFEDRD